MVIVVFFFFLEHTRVFRAYAAIAWPVSVNHKHAVACCIVVLNIQRAESSPEVDGFVIFCCYLWVATFGLLLCFLLLLWLLLFLLLLGC